MNGRKRGPQYTRDDPRKIPLTRDRYHMIVLVYNEAVLKRLEYYNSLGTMSFQQKHDVEFKLRQLEAGKDGSLTYQYGLLEDIERNGFPSLVYPGEGEHNFSNLNQEFIRLLRTVVSTPTTQLHTILQTKQVI